VIYEGSIMSHYRSTMRVWRRRARSRVRRISAAALLGILAAIAGAGTASAAAPTGAVAGLEVLVLGSGGPAALGRASSSYLILIDGKPRILVDAGPGSFARIGEAHVSLEDLDLVLLTHLHVDHAGELPGVVKARAVTAGHPIRFDIYGPEGRTAHADAAAFPSTSRFVDLLFGAGGAFEYLRDFSAPVTFHVTDLAVSGAEKPRILLEQPGLSVRAIAGHHGDAPAVIYRIDRGGRSVVFSGDIDASGLPALETLARGASLLVFDAVVLDPPGSPPILYTLHTPPKAIGELAGRAGIGALLLSHLSPAVDAHRAAVTDSIGRGYRGRVRFASDDLRLAP
jgi:ribonuclease BN (tRNA processing enzyme)